MRVLLTGAAGFIGTAVAADLDTAGVDLQLVDALLPQVHGANPVVPQGLSRLDVRAADDPGVWDELLSGVDAVCHQAAVVGVERAPGDFPLYASHNDVGTAALLTAMARAGVNRLVLASSLVVYGEGGYRCERHGSVVPAERSRERLQAGLFENQCPVCGDNVQWATVPESAPSAPRSAYAASKVAQENYAAAWARHTGGTVVALRYHNVYGPGMPRDSSYCGVAATFRSHLAAGRPPVVFEDGGQMRDFVHVDDIATANRLALQSVDQHEPGRLTAYNIGSGQPVSIGQVAEQLASTKGLTTSVTGDFRPGDVRHIVADCTAARAGIGFAAATAPARGLVAFASEPLRGEAA
ncbi:NAD-dependent epimerase/dehydratase family protein [Rudaeicoccus suwonensis]|uniref:dTDP-L-rhamnose 4-epimerase n=1 Tax=Rudaeicoccus suwonensis TaxID=657409 RepID=A0A561E9G7_9MICO|nr:NAD-dependent epimerase/dehydratase family protein [Rudaeicoccus suwonensis]TWE12259.1 dTDP-L-rhamnose 4-epimerase [Rudaeicoccus suwonensis]